MVGPICGPFGSLPGIPSAGTPNDAAEPARLPHLEFRRERYVRVLRGLSRPDSVLAIHLRPEWSREAFQ